MAKQQRTREENGITLKYRKDTAFAVTEVAPVGSKHMKVVVQAVRFEKKSKQPIPVGPQREGVGGYKYTKDFNENIAYQLAFENAADQVLAM
jgi:hypothetical protein